MSVREMIGRVFGKSRMSTGEGRVWEIDFLRVVAIVLMVIFHIIYDLTTFAGYDIDYLSGFWFWEGKAAALTFMFLSGISSGFSRNTVKRGLKVLGFGMIITLISYFIFREQYIRFGILHFLGVGMILFPALKRVNNVVLFIGTVVIALLAIPFQRISVDTGLLLPFGIMYDEFWSVDYYPLIPYFSVFILGVLAYKKYYYRRVSLFRFSFENRYITLISRNSLLIYLAHQPVIVSVILLIRHIVG